MSAGLHSGRASNTPDCRSGTKKESALFHLLKLGQLTPELDYSPLVTGQHGFRQFRPAWRMVVFYLLLITIALLVPRVPQNSAYASISFDAIRAGRLVG